MYKETELIKKEKEIDYTTTEYVSSNVLVRKWYDDLPIKEMKYR